MAEINLVVSDNLSGFETAAQILSGNCNTTVYRTLTERERELSRNLRNSAKGELNDDSETIFSPKGAYLELQRKKTSVSWSVPKIEAEVRVMQQLQR